MKRIPLLILLAFSLICFSQSDAGIVIGNYYTTGASWDIILPCEDNAATTVVVNTEGDNWTASVNTNTFGDGDSFLMDANSDNVGSPANWTSEKIKIEFTTKFTQNPAVSVDVSMMLDNDGTGSIIANEWMLYRNASDEWSFGGRGSSGALGIKTTTDHTADTSTWWTYTLEIDATSEPWSVTLKQGETLLSWGAWDTNPEASTFNNPLWVGNGSSEPDAYIKDVKILDTT